MKVSMKTLCRPSLLVPCALLALPLLSSVGCGASAEVPGAVLLSLRFASDVSVADRGHVARLAVDVDSAEQYHAEFAAGAVLTGAGPYTVRYRPGVAAGRLDFTVEARDADGAVLARGTASGQLDARDEPHVDVLLSRYVAPTDAAIDAAGDAAMDAASDMGDGGVAPDLAMPDLKMPDLRPPPDLKPPPDLTPPPDLEPPPDLTPPPPDLSGPFVPSHVAGSAYVPTAGDLPTTLSKIDTGALKLYAALDELPLPAGASFIVDANNNAVLSVGAAELGDVTITGTRRLVIVAAGALTVSGHVTASAQGTIPGPGGVAAEGGQGAGGEGSSGGGFDSGGGGAGFGTAGGAGGGALGGTGGAAYGATLADFIGGSGGGSGVSCGPSVGINDSTGAGGAGGGALQLSSAVSLQVTADAIIEANGGGGRGGCFSSTGPVSGGGGGGGAGGMLFLEAPTIEVHGALYANGGGGGAGANSSANQSGASGSDGLAGTTAAPGGASAGNGGSGGSGGVLSIAPTTPNSASNAGGGGGAVGRIWLRTRYHAADQSGSRISPAPSLSTSL